MIYGAILDKGEKHYTYLQKVFDAIGNRQTEYNWLITDCECYPKSPETARLFSQEYCFLSGDELTDIVKSEDFQWIWAVLSGFKKDIPFEEIMKHPLPYANEYEGFWKNPLSIQHPLASVEIVPWDSMLTLILSDDKNIVAEYMSAFPLSRDLAEYNEQAERSMNNAVY